MIGLLISMAFGQEVQYRTVELIDGRTLEVQVIETIPEGLRIEVPQGTGVIALDQLADLQPSDQSRYLAQPPWKVIFSTSPDSNPYLTKRLMRAIDAIPHIERAIPTACPGDILCEKQEYASEPNLWLIVVDGSSVIATTPKSTVEHTYPIDIDGMQSHAPEQLPGLIFGITPATKISPKPNRKPSKALSLVPIPGLSALAAKDYRRFGIAVGITLPVTAAWVYFTGRESSSIVDYSVLSAVGYGVLATGTNLAFTPRERQSDLSWTVLPSTQGATAVVGGRF